MTADAEDGTTAVVSSRLLLWPRRRRRPRDATGFVLGWKQTTTLASSSSRRETVVCAGILPPSESLRTYRQRLTNLRQSCSFDSCSCLVQTLDIVAIWTATPETPTPHSDDHTLPTITQQRRGYPWYVNNDDDSNNAVDFSFHKQLVFYDPPGGNSNAFAHFACEYAGDGNNEWSRLLHQLNHAQELLQCLQQPNVNMDTTTSLPKQQPEKTLEWKKSRVVNDETMTDSSPSSFWSQARLWAIRNSMTLLHFQQLYQQQQTRGAFLQWLSIFSILRCLLQLPPLSDSSGRITTKQTTTQTCRLCGQATLFVDRSHAARRFVTAWDHYLESIIDMSLGMGAALLLFTAWRYNNGNHNNVWSFYTSARRWSMDVLLNAISWLEQFPAGFKLNESLTHNMGREIRNLVQLQQQFLEATFWNVEYGQSLLLPLFLTISAACGWNALLAVLMDLWRLETLHLWVLATTFRHIYRVELFLLSALFRLFRGKKRNLLRQRTDSMQYDAMQLLVGTIAFCICIFLWTTIMVYNVFFVISNWVFNLPVVFLWVSYTICRAIPCGSIGWRLWRPQWFTTSVHLESMMSEEDTTIQDVRVAKLCYVAENPAKLLLSRVSGHVSSLIRWLLNALLEALIPRVSNDAPCSMPFSKLMESYGAHQSGDE